jgi:hypothetical protein
MKALLKHTEARRRYRLYRLQCALEASETSG